MIEHRKEIRVGCRFGRLKIVSKVSGGGLYRTVWRLKCDCGKVVDRSGNSLLGSERGGSRSSCGCSKVGADLPTLRYDALGQRFGKLVVIGPAPRPDRKQGLRWACRCDCGQLTTARSKDLRSGNTKSCGCLKLRASRARKGTPTSIIETGMIFGRLTVREYSHSTLGGRHYVCDCSCGGEKTVRSNALAANQVMSCGCKRHDSWINREAERAIRLARPTP